LQLRKKIKNKKNKKFQFIWPSGFRGEELKKSANQKQESHVAAMFVNGSGRNEHSIGIIYGRSSVKIAHFFLMR
jgi:hypothetical protein